MLPGSRDHFVISWPLMVSPNSPCVINYLLHSVQHGFIKMLHILCPSLLGFLDTPLFTRRMNSELGFPLACLMKVVS